MNWFISGIVAGITLCVLLEKTESEKEVVE